ncbi:SRPBCC domain-containing protein [Nocardia sp. NPDC058058]|uniref:type II toxin-antitoxin system Rv0910 family toxin n=1 Tax=Nocardia sp. NPDC058058 TaxID=3346317 RepID=UPI0036DAAC43
MGSLVVTRVVPSSPEVLFDTIIQPAGWGRWFSIHRDFIDEPPARLREGSTLLSKVVILGMDNEFEWTVEVLDAPHRIVLQGSGRSGFRSEFTYWLQPCDAGTRLTIGGVFTSPYITTALSRTLERHGQLELMRTLEQLAAAVTAGDDRAAEN